MTALGIIEVTLIGIGALLTLAGVLYMRDKANRDQMANLLDRVTDLRTWTSAEIAQLSSTCFRRDELKDHLEPIRHNLSEVRHRQDDMKADFVRRQDDIIKMLTEIKMAKS